MTATDDQGNEPRTIPAGTPPSFRSFLKDKDLERERQHEYPDGLLAPRFTHRPGEGAVLAEDLRGAEQRQLDHERLRRRGGLLAARLGEDQAVPPFQVAAYEGDCGLDLAITGEAVIEPGNIANLACGVAVALPPGTFGWITGRSSTWSKWGLQVMPGIIDEGWRGELYAMVYRPVLYPAVGDHRLVVPAGTRLAQVIILPNLMAQTRLYRVMPDDLPGSDRGTQGFGSTG